MSMTKIKRGKAPAKRSRAAAPGAAKRKNARAQKISRIDAFIRALPVSAQTVQRAANWGIGALVLTALWVGAQATGVTAKVDEEWAQAVGRAGFQVRKVEVVGADRIDRLKVYDIALAQQNRSMAAVDIHAVRSDLLKYGWIKDARVSRRLPETLVIDIVERTPAAVWQHQSKLSLIDAKGVVLEPVTVATMPDLPLVIGPNANRKSGDLERLLDNAPALKPLLAGASWVGNRRWDLRFQSGETLALPEGAPESAKALVNFARMDGVNRLLGRGVVRFDMRDPDRFVLRLPPEGTVSADTVDAATDTAQADDSEPEKVEG